MDAPPKRYINNKALCSIVRPQPYKMCSLLSIYEMICTISDGTSGTAPPPSFEYMVDHAMYSAEDMIDGKIGNEKMRELAAQYGLTLRVCKALDEIPDWEGLKAHLYSGRPIIYHTIGHYLLIIGYIEEPMMISSGDRPKVSDGIGRWLVTADHRVKFGTTHDRGMLEQVRWEAVIGTVVNNPNTALLI